jgi:uncharacterized integral membrane protein
MKVPVIIGLICLAFFLGFLVCAIFASTKIAKLEQEIHELKRGN